MKLVLVLCLLAFMSCQRDIMDIARCLYENTKVKEIIADVRVAIATKDFSKLWPKIKEALPELIPVVIKCVTENEVNLEKVKQPFILNWLYEPKDYEDCMKHCYKPRERCKAICEAKFNAEDTTE